MVVMTGGKDFAGAPRAGDASNATATDFPDVCAHELIERQAAASPDAIALVHLGRTMTYGELNARANAIAHHLRKHGVGPDVLVAVCLQRCPDMVAALLGVWKAGGAYVPLDPSYPSDRLAFMIGDAETAVVLTHEPCRAACGDERDEDLPRHRLAAHRHRAGRRSSAARQAGEPRLRHVHLGLDGQSEGRDDPARRPRQLSLVGEAGLCRGARPLGAGSFLHVVRPDRDQPLCAAGRRRFGRATAGGRRRRKPDRGTAGQRQPQPHQDHAGPPRDSA